jgi:peptide deformylase
VNTWFHRKGFPYLNGPALLHEEVPDEDKQLDKNDYDIYINPLILAETTDVEYGWEFSASFPGIRAMVKRPVGIKVSYLNTEGDEIEQEFYNFRARMWLHQLDYLNGKVMTHWRASEGNVDIIDGHKDHYKNL